MKKLLLLITICISTISFGQYTSIPDPNFEQALIDLGHDDVIDGQVLTSNISGLDSLDVSYKQISSLVGITSFSSLVYLDCQVNNALQSIELTNCPMLQELNCSVTDINELDLSNLPELRRLFCYWTDIQELDLSNNPLIWKIDSEDTFLTSLDVSQNSNLQYLDVDRCNLNCLNVQNGNNSILSYLHTNENPNLYCIQVDDQVYSENNWSAGNGHDQDPFTSYSQDCGNDCSGTSNLTELNSNQPKELIKIVNLLGQEVEYTPNTVLIYQYSDGTSEKVFTIED